MFGEVFHTFSSIPHVAKAVQRVVTRLFNPTTGQSYSSSSEGQAAVALEWSVPTFQSMVGSGDKDLVRSAVARAMYQGVRVRLSREAPKAGGKRGAKAEDD